MDYSFLITTKSQNIGFLLLILLFNSCQQENTLPPNNQSISSPKIFDLTHPGYQLESETKQQFFSNTYCLVQNLHLSDHQASAANFRNVDPTIDFIKYIIDHQDDEEDFIPMLIDSVGYPVWPKAQILDRITLIPFIKEDAELTEGVLVVKLDQGNIDFKLLYRNRIYNNILAENIHLNYLTELETFQAFDWQLFQNKDRLLQKAVEEQRGQQGNFRCPAHYFWECADWIRPLSDPIDNPEASDRSNPCGSLCTDCILFVYVPDDCLGNHYPAGWGNTNGNTTPPRQNGNSGYGGGSGNSAFPPENPLHWWEEKNYPGLLNSIIEDLGLELEEEFMAECLARNFQLQSVLRSLMDQMDLTEEASVNRIKNALSVACTCDEYDDRGREQCDEVEIFASELLFFPVCKESFNNFTPTGDGATITMECNRMEVYVIVIPDVIDSKCYDLPDLCITTGKFEIIDENTFEPLGSNTRKQLSAKAYELSGKALNDFCIMKFLTEGQYPTNLQVQDFFKTKLVEELSSRITGVAVNYSGCTGSGIGTGRPLSSYFGICLPSPCNC